LTYNSHETSGRCIAGLRHIRVKVSPPDQRGLPTDECLVSVFAQTGQNNSRRDGIASGTFRHVGLLLAPPLGIHRFALPKVIHRYQEFCHSLSSGHDRLWSPLYNDYSFILSSL
jgi:hypothetical protein